MNKIFTPPPRRPTTRAADGLPRWRWTVAEIEKMAVDGYFREEEQFELLGGEIVPMSPKGRHHEIIRGELAFHFTRLAPDDVESLPSRSRESRGRMMAVARRKDINSQNDPSIFERVI